MRILLADPNRDLLSSYQALLEKNGHTVRIAFDGARVLTLLGESAFDFAIVNERLPRIRHDRVIRNLHDAEIPILVLLDRPLTRKILLRRELANAYLSFPFSPEELFAVMEDVRKKAAETLDVMGVSVSGFRFTGTDIRLTAGEVDVLHRLSKGERLTGGGYGVWVYSLNWKLERLPEKQRVQIAYTARNGYGLARGGETS